MSSNRAMDFATLLYRQLPAVYRERDLGLVATDGSVAPGDLARLADTWGDLLDALYRTLLQRYHDIFPENEGVDAEGLLRGCQPWVLPYLAQLLDVRLISPLESGRRLEVGHAVAWRQRKGTPRAIENIAEAVAGMEVEIREGWQRVATTPRAGFTLLPAAVFGEAEAPFDARWPDHRADHPGLPGGTVDLRHASRAIRSPVLDPATKVSRFAGEAVPWRLGGRHGVPCFPGSFQDMAARTADLRTPDSRRGHAHPRRVVLHTPPFPGFFAAQPVGVQWSAVRDAVLAGEPLPAGVPLRHQRVDDEGGERRLLVGLGEQPVRIRGVVELDLATRWSFTNLWFDNRLEIRHASVELDGCAARQLYLHEPQARTVSVSARASLFKQLLAPRALVALEYVTVLERLVAERLQASDCLFLNQPRKDLIDFDVPAQGCIRFSRLEYLPPALPGPGEPPPPIPPARDWLAQGARSALRVHEASCSTLVPIFWNTEFGRPGCAVLHPDSDPALRFGAEDGGEMGACHALAYTLREKAVLDKLQEMLPVGIEAVLAPDASLDCPPPQPRQGE